MEVLAVIVGAVVIPIVAWHIVGARRWRDPLLLPALIFALGSTIAGLAELLETGLRLDWKLTIGVVSFCVVAWRWKQSSGASEPAA